MRTFWTLPVLLLAVGCSPSPEKVSFQGTWTLRVENSLAGTADATGLEVRSRYPQYRIKEVTPQGEVVRIFDGHTLSTFMRFTGDPDPEAAPSVVPPTFEPLTPEKAAQQRFWARTLTGHFVAGGQVCGRDTRLYEEKGTSLGGVLSRQLWVDDETGIILKDVSTVYSTQVNQLVRRQSAECLSLAFVESSDADFVKP